VIRVHVANILAALEQMLSRDGHDVQRLPHHHPGCCGYWSDIDSLDS